MSIRPLLKLLKNDQLLAFTNSAALLKPFYQLVYLAVARKDGLFDLLSGGPVRFEQLAETYCKNDRAQEALEAWLHLGIRLGYLELGTRNDMDEPVFKHFVGSLVRHSCKSPFMVTILNIPSIAAIPYFYFYGFGNRWIITGLALWLIGGLVSKAIKVPIYKSVAGLQSDDMVRLGKERIKLNTGNILQAILNCVAAFVMMIAFIR